MFPGVPTESALLEEIFKIEGTPAEVLQIKLLLFNSISSQMAT